MDDDDDFDEVSLLRWKRHIQSGLKKVDVSSGQIRGLEKTSHFETSTLKSDQHVTEVMENHLSSLTRQECKDEPVVEDRSMHCATEVLPVMDANPSVAAPSVTNTYTDYGTRDMQCVAYSPSSTKQNCKKQRRKYKSPSKTCPDKGQTSLLKFVKIMKSDTHHLKTSTISQLPQEGLPTQHICCRVPSKNMSTDIAGNVALQSMPSITPAIDVGTSTCGRKKKKWQASMSKANRECPFYKRVPETGIVVDAFNYGTIPGCPAYFLTHFHADHYTQLNSRFQHPIYCSQATANLVQKVLKVSPSLINPLPLDIPCNVEGVEVTLIDANHCPGAVMFLFKTASGKNYLHTGDFRYCVPMTSHPSLNSCTIHHLFLDTTYCKPQYSFPTQQEVIEFAIGKCREAIHRFPGTVIVSGTYKVGKERLYLALAEALGSRICVSKDKEDILKCLQWPALESLLTTSPLVASVHVLPMMKLNMKELSSYLSSLQPVFSHLLAFKPTGWTHSTKRPSLSSLCPKTAGRVTVYNLPYSEHSNFSEIRQFVQWLQPQKVTSTIGNVSVATRNETMCYLEEWRKGMKASTSLAKQTFIGREVDACLATHRTNL